MFLRWKRPYRRIYGVIGSCLCSVLWIYATVWFASTQRSIVFPLIAAVVFSICAVAELSAFRKYGNQGKPFAGRKSRPVQPDAQK